MVEENQTNENEAEEVIEEVAVDALSSALAEEKQKAENYLANWQRSQADFINYKRRVEQEKKDIGKFAQAEIVVNLLPVLDDLERALSAVPSDVAKSTLTSCSQASDKVTVNSKLVVPALPSGCATSLMESDSSTSSFSIVHCPWSSEMVALTALLKFTKKVSSLSTT